MAALVRRFAAGAGLTALALVLLLAAGTGEARLALFGGLLALALLGWAVAFLRCVARQVAGFTDELCRTLDGMLDRSARPAPAAPAETLSAGSTTGWSGSTTPWRPTARRWSGRRPAWKP